jgi:membrane-associated PAP2 superfamily phosphatase
MTRKPMHGDNTGTNDNSEVAEPRMTLSDLALWPTLAFFYLLPALQLSGVDNWVARRFYDPSVKAFPLRNDFWTSAVMHTGGRRFMIAVVLVVLATWLLSLRVKQLREWRRLLGYVLLCVLLSVALVNLGKRFTNVDCPWNLAEYGGVLPHYGLVMDKPESLPVGHCFPGGHSSGGFAWFALFFVGRRRAYRPAWFTLAPAVTIGMLFAADEWVSGAPFPSHDLTTAYVCWMIALAIYAWMFQHDEKGTGPGYTPAPDSGSGL